MCFLMSRNHSIICLHDKWHRSSLYSIVYNAIISFIPYTR